MNLYDVNQEFMISLNLREDHYVKWYRNQTISHD